MVELREVEIFLVLADELHFGRAARRLYLSQSRVSQTIRRLEGEVGGRLFERTSRSVRLTPVGEKLRDRLAPSYAELRQAFEDARDISTGVVGTLTVSTPILGAAGPSFARVRETFRNRHPGCEIFVRDDRVFDGLAALRRGDCDLVVAYLPLAQPDLTIGPVLQRENRILLVRAGHPLLDRGYATVEDLGDYRVSRLDHLAPPEMAVAFCPLHTPQGRPIERHPHRFDGMADVFAAIADGVVVAPSLASVPEYYSYPGVTHIPLRDLPPMETALVWVTVRETAVIRAFAQVTGEICGL